MNSRWRTDAKFFALIGSLLLATVAVPAQAGQDDKTRTASGAYLVPSILAFSCQETNGVGCVQFLPRRGERYIHVEVRDAGGMAVYAYVNQDSTNDGISDIDGPICGRTQFPLRIVPGVPVRVFVLPTYEMCPGAVATHGTVEATFGGSYGVVRKATSR